jgi:hypothetical protein
VYDLKFVWLEYYYHAEKNNSLIQNKNGKKKEFIKLHIAMDAKSAKVVSFRLTKGNVQDSMFVN